MLELASRGSLFDYLQKSAFNDESMIRYMALQIFSGVKHMVEHGFAHRDIKAENICLDKSFNLKLIDWGFAIPYLKGQKYNDAKGS